MASYCGPEGFGPLTVVDGTRQLTPCFVDSVLFDGAALLVAVVTLATLICVQRKTRTKHTTRALSVNPGESERLLATSDTSASYSVYDDDYARSWHTPVHNARWIVVFLLLVLTLVMFAANILSFGSASATPIHALLTPIVLFIAFIFSLVTCHHCELVRRSTTMIALLPAWLAMSLGASALTHRIVVAIPKYDDDIRFWNYLAFAILCFSLIVMELVTLLAAPRRGLRPQRDQNGEDTRTLPLVFRDACANFYSYVTFSFMVPTIRKGYRAPLEQTDLGRLPPADIAASLYADFDRRWRHSAMPHEHKKRSLWTALAQCFWKPMVIALGCMLAGNLLAFLGPICLNGIVTYVTTVQQQHLPHHSSSVRAPSSILTLSAFFANGFVLIGVLLLGNCLQSTLMQNHHQIVMRAGVHARACLQTAIFNKSLQLTNKERQELTAGQIANHMSTDTSKILFWFYFVNYTFALPLQIAIALALIVGQLGIVGLTGLAMMVVLMPVQARLVTLQSRWQKKIIVAEDDRLKKTDELLQNVKVIKCMSWETFFVERLGAARAHQLHCLVRSGIVRAFTVFLMTATPVLVTLSSFAAFAFVSDEPLTPQRAFTSISLFNMLRMPLNFLPLIFNTWVDATVSVKRLRSFYTRDEIAPHAPQLLTTQDNLVRQHERFFRHSTISSGAPVRRRGNSESEWDFEHSQGGDGSEHSLLGATTAVATGGNSDAGDLRPVAVSFVRAQLAWDTQDEEEEDEDKEEEGYEKEGHLSSSSSTTHQREVTQPTMASTSTTAGQLHSITMSVPQGQLTLIVGAVGSGKSSLISAILGEMNVVSGHRVVNGVVFAYAAQEPFIMNATLRDNIVFGCEYDVERYNDVVRACALEPDFAMLPAGDMTEIGERGVNLSGGQKARVSIGRAMYFAPYADMVIFDDPLSALDAHTGRHVFQEVILPLVHRHHKTVVLSTHYLHLASQTDHVVVLEACAVRAQGHPNQQHVRDAIEELQVSAVVVDEDETLVQDAVAGGNEASNALLVKEEDVAGGSSGGMTATASASLQVARATAMKERQISNISTKTVVSESAVDVIANAKGGTTKKKDGDLIDKEERETGAVAWSVYMSYASACGAILCFCTLLVFMTSRGILVYTDYWLSEWSSSGDVTPNVTNAVASLVMDQVTALPLFSTITGKETPVHTTKYWLTGYAILSGASMLVALLTAGLIIYAGLRASRKLHIAMVDSIASAPMQYFDATPIGRILNRFSGDLNTVDSRMPSTLQSLLSMFLQMIASVIVQGIVTPIFLAAAAPILVVYFYMQRFFRSTSRELQRLESLSKSPVFGLLSQSLHGVATIRAYGVQERFMRIMTANIDASSINFLFLNTCNRWLGCFLEYLGATIVFFGAASIVGNAHRIDPGLAGLSLSYALTVTSSLNWMVRAVADAEMNMNAVERIEHYSRLESEEALNAAASLHASQGRVVRQKEPPREWPAHGRIELIGVSVRYRDGLDPALRRLSVVIEAGQRVGVCGRTGAGKSSLTLALLRLVFPHEGTILIDDLSTASVPLRTLRARLAIIPQSPVLFAASVRFNLDPHGRASDTELWEALRRAQLHDAVRALDGGLNATIAEGGANFSVGQRQLFSVARAFLRNAKVLLLDEATASVDLKTDEQLQKVLRDEFVGRTVLIIAHRIKTIIDCDRILVLDAGQMVEFDSPARLLSDPKSVFSSLVAASEEQSE